MKRKTDPKKAVIFLVEGLSDKNALEMIIKKIYQNRNVVFVFTDGDISSDESVTVGNVEDKIYDIVKKISDEFKLEKKDIFQIVQLFDMDGAYIPDHVILKGQNSNFLYTLQSIISSRTEDVKKRNQHKREVMDKLQKLREIKHIPYTAYYMSCNLDHVLYNKQNLEHDKKIEYADSFYELFKGKESKFVDFLEMEAVNGVPETSLDATWEYIKHGLHSLERHTNLHYYFIDHPPFAL